jgi:hypothetical protein
MDTEKISDKLSRIVPIIEINKPNTIGNIYSYDSIGEIIKRINDRFIKGEVILGFTENNKSYITPNDPTHDVENWYIEDGFLLVKVRFYDTKKSKTVLKMFSDGNLILRATIAGSVDIDTKEIDVRDLISIDFLPISDKLIPKAEWIKIT